VLQLENLVIVKLGGSVITHKEISPPTVNEEHLSRIVKELAAHDGKLIIVLGGGAHGHQAAYKYGYGNPDTAPIQLLQSISYRHRMNLGYLQLLCG
jgi:isopentenyl phosphate kinase